MSTGDVFELVLAGSILAFIIVGRAAALKGSRSFWDTSDD